MKPFQAILILLLNMTLLSSLSAQPRWKGSKLEGTGRLAYPYRAIPVMDSQVWNKPLALTAVPGQPGGYLVLERNTNIWLLNAKGQRSSFLKLQGSPINARFDPEFPDVPHVYIRFSSHATNRLHRFTVIQENDSYHADPTSAKVILEWPTNGHRGGDLDFGPDGFLFLATGDGQKPGDPANTGQKTDNLLGSILRLDVRSDSEDAYRVPRDNPFIGIPNVRPEIWAYGLRNPWRFDFYPGTNELWIGDNGDENWEMVLRVRKGENHGWSAFEGSHIFRVANKLEGPTLTHTLPIVEHPHREMRSIIGGFWYQGSQFPELRNHYIYGGYMNGKIWGFSLNKEGAATKPKQLTDLDGQIVSFSEDPENEILIVTMDRGMFKLGNAPKVKRLPTPKLLSETGLFESTPNHTAAPGLMRYKVNLPAYRNGATTERYIGIPLGQQIKFQASHVKIDRLPPLRTRAGLDRMELPDGSVVFQTFLLGEQRIETQISLNDSGEWRFLTYRWHSDQQDATLVLPAGENHTITLENGTKQPWRFPGESECATCHSHLTRFTPGLNLAQLNRTLDYNGTKKNQLAYFKDARFLPKHLGAQPASMIFPKPSDDSASLEDRARAYLHVNCATCHREAGVAGRATIQLLSWLKNEDLQALDQKPVVGLPGGDEKRTRLIASGHPEHSDILRRMESDGPGRMPLIGSDQVDQEGVQLIREWIESLSTEN